MKFDRIFKVILKTNTPFVISYYKRGNLKKFLPSYAAIPKESHATYVHRLQ